MDQPVSERMLNALVKELLRRGEIDQEHVFAAADELDAMGDDEAAHAMRVLPIEAAMQRQTEWNREQQRKRIRSLDGGKSEGG